MSADTITSLRRAKIIELVSTGSICTQHELMNALKEAGFSVTQATVSRDVRSLHLVKVRGRSGQRCYAIDRQPADADQQALVRVFRSVVLSIAHSESLVVLRTLNASAGAAAEAIDQMCFPEILGTIAGDNTIFVAASSSEAARNTAARFAVLLHGTETSLP